MSTSDDLTSLATPPSCIADFCLIPLGTPTASVSKEVAEVQRLLKKSGLDYSMHSAGTTVGMAHTHHLTISVGFRVRANSSRPVCGRGGLGDGGVYGTFLNAYANYG
jgi:hypothetical protein